MFTAFPKKKQQQRQELVTDANNSDLGKSRTARNQWLLTMAISDSEWWIGLLPNSSIYLLFLQVSEFEQYPAPYRRCIFHPYKSISSVSISTQKIVFTGPWNCPNVAKLHFKSAISVFIFYPQFTSLSRIEGS